MKNFITIEADNMSLCVDLYQIIAVSDTGLAAAPSNQNDKLRLAPRPKYELYLAFKNNSSTCLQYSTEGHAKDDFKLLSEMLMED